MKITKDFLPISKYSRPGTKLKKVTKVAVHYVGGAGGTAAGVRSWFGTVSKGYWNGSGYTYASSHYVVGLNGEIIQMIPENEISYCTNSANSYSISIENCHATKDGHFNKSTYNSLVELCADICKRYKLNPINDLIRHYDVTGKACPLWWTPLGSNKNYNKDWNQFKQDVKNKMNGVSNVDTKKEELEVKKAIDVKVNGQLGYTDGYFADGKNLFTADFIRSLGFNVSVDNNTKVVSIDNNDKKPIKIIVNGKDVEVNTIFRDNLNHVTLRELANLGLFDIDYKDGIVYINSKK